MNYNINLNEANTVQTQVTYSWDLILKEHNGICKIKYFTNSPLLCSGTINLCKTDNGGKIVAHEEANPDGGRILTQINPGVQDGMLYGMY